MTDFYNDFALTHWIFYKGKWRNVWLQNTHADVAHDVATSPREDKKLDCWHEQKENIYTEFELFAKGINPRINTTENVK